MIKPRIDNIKSTSKSQTINYTPQFVQAIHDYLPTLENADKSASCLFFKRGSIIEVFNKDDSGWWDGQCGSVRGWFPSNYVCKLGVLKHQSADFKEDYKATQELNLLNRQANHNINNLNHQNTKLSAPKSRTDMAFKAYTCSKNKIESDSLKPSESNLHLLVSDVGKRVKELVDLCGQSIPFDVQAYNSQVVASVRSLFVETNIVNKESYVFKLHPELGRQRKIILNSLSRLVLKTKEHQQLENKKEKNREQISLFAKELIKEVHLLEKIARLIPKRPLSSNYASPPSITFTESSIIHSASVNSLDQSTTQLHGSAYGRVQTSKISTEKTLDNLIVNKDRIDTSIHKLKSFFDGYIKNPSSLTEILDQTRKVMESVISFLSVVEKVCSSISDLDYNRRMFMIPEDPSHVSLIITKESVYSAITNLVTSVRHLTGHDKQTDATNQNTHSITKKEYDHLYSCCEGVLKAAKECTFCLKTCLLVEIEGENINQHLLICDMQEDPKPDLKFSSRIQPPITQTTVATHRSSSPSPDNQIDHLQDHPPAIPSGEKTIESLDVSEKKQNSSGQAPKTPDQAKKYKRWSYSKDSDRSSNLTDVSTTPPLERPQMEPTLHLPPLLPLTPHLPVFQDPFKEGRLKDQPLRSRLTRGLSVSLRPSFSTRLSKSDPPLDRHLIESSIFHNFPSWHANGSTLRPKKSVSLKVGPTLSLPLGKKNESDYFFFKQDLFHEDQMIFNDKGEVLCATIEALVTKLTTYEKKLDPNFSRAFFYSFRSFINPPDLLKMLIHRFSLQPPPGLVSEAQEVLWTNRVLIPTRLRVNSVLRTWLEIYFNLDLDGLIEHDLLNFVSNEMSKTMPGHANRMIQLIQKTFHPESSTFEFSLPDVIPKKSASTTLYSSISKSSASHLFSNLISDHPVQERYPQPVLGKSLKSSLKKTTVQNVQSILHLANLEPVELARQLTLIESRLFCQIQPCEMIGQEFKKKIGQSQAIHVKAMIKKSTEITSWVSQTILEEPDIKKRASLLKRWIKVGEACLQINNFNTLMAIRSALDSASVIRLKKTWDCLSLKHKSTWEVIRKATDSQRNFAEYRQRLRDTTAPCLPFLGIYLTDMTFIDEGNPNHKLSSNGVKLINFNKYIKMCKILNEIHKFQVPHKFIEIEEIQEYLKTTLATVEQDDQKFYFKSLHLEPKEGCS